MHKLNTQLNPLKNRRRYLQIALQKNFLCVCLSCLSVCLLICQSRPNGWRWTPHMGYHRITNFMKNVLGIIFCLAVWLAVWLAVFKFLLLNFFLLFQVEILGPQGPLASKNNI